MDGSLGKHISDTIDSRLVSKSASTALNLFASQNHAAGIYVRNPSVWCADLPEVITCLSPWNSTGGNTRAGTLISPRHIIFAAHYQVSTGAEIRFVTPDNQVVLRKMVGKITHPDHNPQLDNYDLTVGVLDADVPSEISFAKVLPDNFEEYLPRLNQESNAAVPCLTLDQEEKALVTDLFRDSGSISTFSKPIDTKRQEFYESKIGGDSGNPGILIVNGEPIIITVWTWGGSGQGTSIRYAKAAINAMMSTLGGGYTLTEADFSRFTNFA